MNEILGRFSIPGLKMLSLPPAVPIHFPRRSDIPMAADYSMTAELLASHGVAATVSEIHGVLSGQICTGNTSPDLELTQALLEIEGGIAEVITNLFKLLSEDINKQLRTEDYTFHPLLPDDDESLNSRLAALASWCDGFNAGFAGAWAQDDSAMLQETREVLDDFSRIAQVDEEEDNVPDAESEVNLMEVIEYARMAAITVYLQNNDGRLAVSEDGDLPEGTELH